MNLSPCAFFSPKPLNDNLHLGLRIPLPSFHGRPPPSAALYTVNYALVQMGSSIRVPRTSGMTEWLGREGGFLLLSPFSFFPLSHKGRGSSFLLPFIRG